MKKIAVFILVILIFGISFSLDGVFARNYDNPADVEIPEKDGVYGVPGHPELKVRVFVHKAKPQPEPEPSVLICGLADFDATSTIPSAGWYLPQGQWFYSLNPGSVPSAVGSANLAVMAADAFGRLTGTTGVVFTKSSDTRTTRAVLDGKNIITWGRASASALGVTYIWYDGTGLVKEVDTIMNNKFAWRWSDPSSWVNPTCAYQNYYDAQNILTHELGHWMGLDDVYTADYQDATMYGYGSKTETKKNTLSSGDIAGINAIYNK